MVFPPCRGRCGTCSKRKDDIACIGETLHSVSRAFLLLLVLVLLPRLVWAASRGEGACAAHCHHPTSTDNDVASGRPGPPSESDRIELQWVAVGTSKAIEFGKTRCGHSLSSRSRSDKAFLTAASAPTAAGDEQRLHHGRSQGDPARYRDNSAVETLKPSRRKVRSSRPRRQSGTK